MLDFLTPPPSGSVHQGGTVTVGEHIELWKLLLFHGLLFKGSALFFFFFHAHNSFVFQKLVNTGYDEIKQTSLTASPRKTAYGARTLQSQKGTARKTKSLPAVTSPPARGAYAMSSVTEQFVSPSSCHCTGQVLEDVARYPLYVAFQQCSLSVGDTRNQHRAIRTSVLVSFLSPSHPCLRDTQFGNLQRMLVKNK